MAEITCSFMFSARNMSMVILFSQSSSLIAFLQTQMIEVGSFSFRNCQQDSLFSYLAFLREHSLYIYRLYLFPLCFKVSYVEASGLF